jgi:hypothetical protein
MYLISVKYENDAERKRMEYVFEKWSDKLKITKPEGLLVLIDADSKSAEFQEFIENLLSRTSQITSKNLTIFKIEPESIDIEKEKKELNLEVHEKRATIEKLLNFVMARQKVLVTQVSNEPNIKYYEVTTKKGKAEIRIMIDEKPESVHLQIKISGYGDVVGLMYDRLKEEMDYFGV